MEFTDTLLAMMVKYSRLLPPEVSAFMLTGLQIKKPTELMSSLPCLHSWGITHLLTCSVRACLKKQCCKNQIYESAPPWLMGKKVVKNWCLSWPKLIMPLSGKRTSHPPSKHGIMQPILKKLIGGTSVPGPGSPAG